MKPYKIVLCSLMLLATGCVQKTSNHIVKVVLQVNNRHDIKTAGIRGDGNPLSWNNDYPMQEIIKDSLYQAVFTINTGFGFFEMKCTINGEYELKEKPDRHIILNKRDTTFCHIIFNKEEQHLEKMGDVKNTEPANQDILSTVAMFEMPFKGVLAFQY